MTDLPVRIFDDRPHTFPGDDSIGAQMPTPAFPNNTGFTLCTNHYNEAPGNLEFVGGKDNGRLSSSKQMSVFENKYLHNTHDEFTNRGKIWNALNPGEACMSRFNAGADKKYGYWVGCELESTYRKSIVNSARDKKAHYIIPSGMSFSWRMLLDSNKNPEHSHRLLGLYVGFVGKSNNTVKLASIIQCSKELATDRTKVLDNADNCTFSGSYDYTSSLKNANGQDIGSPNFLHGFWKPSDSRGAQIADASGNATGFFDSTTMSRIISDQLLPMGIFVYWGITRSTAGSTYNHKHYLYNMKMIPHQRRFDSYTGYRRVIPGAMTYNEAWELYYGTSKDKSMLLT